jgi:hypothetical protein
MSDLALNSMRKAGGKNDRVQNQSENCGSGGRGRLPLLGGEPDASRRRVAEMHRRLPETARRLRQELHP